MKRTAIEGPEIRVTVRLPADVWRRIRVQAAREDASALALVNRLLTDGIEREEKEKAG